MLEGSLSGVGMVLSLGRDAWSMVKKPRQGTNEHASMLHATLWRPSRYEVDDRFSLQPVPLLSEDVPGGGENTLRAFVCCTLYAVRGAGCLDEF